MADVRSLLRQQNQARRIEHRYAAYSDAGKLLCTLCRDQIRAESQWESHLQSDSHRQSQEAAKQAQAQAASAAAAATTAPSQNGEESLAPSQKRKIDDDNTENMDMEDAVRRKRSRADISIPPEQEADSSPAAPEHVKGRKEVNRTPPTLVRRMSSTPSRGVEIQIPSRPATPAHRESSTSTPGAGSLNSGTAAAGTPTLSAHANSKVGGDSASKAGAHVDEDEWAAFEADIAAASAPYSEDAVISAPAMNAEQAAAASAAGDADRDGGDQSKRKLKGEVDIADEREDATRAMEDEFDDMQELEARVKRLKEKREDLRKRTESMGQDSSIPKPQAAVDAAPAEAVVSDEDEDEVDDDEDDEDEDEDEDDWDGFRFRTS